MQSEAFALLKYSFGLGSKIFTAVVLINAVSAWFAGNFDTNYERLINQFTIIISCVAVTFIYEKIKGKFWIKVLISYLAMLAINMLFVLLLGILNDGATLEDYINTAVVSTGFYIIVTGIVLFIEAKKTEHK